MRNVLIAATLVLSTSAFAAQNDEAQMRHVLEMEGVGQVLPAVATKPAAKPTLQARAEVLAEVQRNRAAGELRAANEEIGDFALPTRNTEPVTRLGQWIKRAASR